MRLFSLLLLCFGLVLVSAQITPAQTSCVNKDDVNLLLTKLNSQQNVSLNKKLQAELLKLQEQHRQLVREAIASNSQEKLARRISELREKNEARLCQNLKEFGWPTKSLVGSEGLDAALFLIQNSASVQLQIDLFPVVVAAVKKGELEKNEFAGYFDRVRVRSGLKQLFGTEVTITNGLLVLVPIEDEANVDARRQQYGLPPLADSLKYLEESYLMPLVRSPRVSDRSADSAENSAATKLSPASAGIPSVAGDEIIRIDTQLVNLNVSVFSNSLKTYVSTLGKDDFAVFEDGHQETITFFEATNEPFDLVLLIDLSASTSGKRDLIRKSTQRFIEAARPSDRLAIVTFSESVNVVSPLTGDRVKLLGSIGNMKGVGGTRVWDALKFTLDEILGPKLPNRRKAVVLMSDGADNALMFQGHGSEISFSDLLEVVRRSDTLIIPIYLDTENEEPWNKRMYRSARATLELLANESGGLYYKARKLEDLKGVYEQVINDLGKVYSLGYTPSNSKRDGLWRRVKVQIPSAIDLITRTRPGYYAN